MDIKFTDKKNMSTVTNIIGEAPQSELRTFIVDYVGNKKSENNSDEVTIEMVIEVLAEEFPDFLLAVAEENWIRGYHQAFNDISSAEENSQ